MELSSQQMARMSRLLDEALTLDPAARRVWLERLAPDCQDLVPALRAALLTDGPNERGADHLDTLPKLDLDANEPVPSSDLHPGQRVGPYELIRPLGSGGMAEVWLSRRADGAFRREVALKLPLLNWLRKDLDQRFVCERDILASLEHPNIARMYDAGVDTAAGLPYLAMEYVPGQSLTIWSDQHQLVLHDRVRLFLQVLGAVQFAHEHQVIHRDLKPSNILVTASGQVRLLDFGVAKLLSVGHSEHTQLTAVHGRALTPAYASPEMRCGEAVDARTDIYSLGVLLSELLTGRRADGAVSLQGDLGSIMQKALANDPSARFSTAAEFAQDLERYLKGLPVHAHARPGTLSYRGRKFLLRNRTLVTVCTIGIVTCGLIAGYLRSHPTLDHPPAPQTPPITAFAPPAHSVAVLPFRNLSGDVSQEYFSDGLSEEVLNSLAQVEGLQVAARTSSFSFKGKDVDVPTIARRLNVGAVLEGSVRRSGNRVRVAVQLINAATGFQLWSHTYEQDLTDVLTLQRNLAVAVAEQLDVTLSGNAISKLGQGGTNDPRALDAYLRGSQIMAKACCEPDWRRALAAFDEAISLDPGYAAAYAVRATALVDIGINTSNGVEMAVMRQRAWESAESAVRLAPDSAEMYAVRSFVRSMGLLDLGPSTAEDVRKAMSLAPGAALVQKAFSLYSLVVGHREAAVSASKRALELDPENSGTRRTLVQALTAARRYSEALHEIEAAQRANPARNWQETIGDIHNAMGRPELAEKECASTLTLPNEAYACLAIAYRALGKQVEAEEALRRGQAKDGPQGAFDYARVYAQWGNVPEALKWLQAAARRRAPEVMSLRTEWTLDPLRSEPEFQAIERQFNFPPIGQ